MGDVALSFDNGPDPAVTPIVLDVLARRGVKASFFVLGKNLASPERMKLASARRPRGIESAITRTRIGYRSARTRRRTPSIPKSQRRNSCSARLLKRPKLFRPFGGGGKIGPHLLSRAAVDHLVANRYSCVLWNCVPEDWIDQDAWVDRALRDASTRSHTLVVMHDILPRAMSHLDRFIGALVDAGHRMTQEFPAECMPIERGEIVRDISGFVSSPRADAGEG